MTATLETPTPVDNWLVRASRRDAQVFRLAKLSAWAEEWGQKALDDISDGNESAAARTTTFAIGWAREVIQQIELLEVSQ